MMFTSVNDTKMAAYETSLGRLFRGYLAKLCLAGWICVWDSHTCTHTHSPTCVMYILKSFYCCWWWWRRRLWCTYKKTTINPDACLHCELEIENKTKTKQKKDLKTRLCYPCLLICICGHLFGMSSGCSHINYFAEMFIHTHMCDCMGVNLMVCCVNIFSVGCKNVTRLRLLEVM